MSVAQACLCVVMVERAVLGFLLRMAQEKLRVGRHEVERMQEMHAGQHLLLAEKKRVHGWVGWSVLGHSRPQCPEQS